MPPSKKKYQVFHPDHETTVHYLLGMKNAINSDNFAELFEKSGLLDKKPDEWFFEQILLDIFNELAERGSATLDFVAIGIQLAKDLEFPPEFLPLPFEEKLSTLASQYGEFNRGTDVGYVQGSLVAPQHVLYRIKTPEPDDIWYGIFYGCAKRFIPKDTPFLVYYDEEIPRREEGGEETLIHIKWGVAF